jgi:hypothetical protein
MRFRQLDVDPRIPNVPLPQRGITGMRKDLVDAATQHHVATQKERQQAITHGFRLD